MLRFFSLWCFVGFLGFRRVGSAHTPTWTEDVLRLPSRPEDVRLWVFLRAAAASGGWSLHAWHAVLQSAVAGESRFRV